MQRMARTLRVAVCGGLLAFSLASGIAWAQDLATAPPGGEFQPVSKLVPLPDFIPGMGTLYVDPDTLPVGPFLGYDRDGRLVNVTFMVPLDDLVAHRNWTDLADIANWFPVEHVDLMYNPGHPGVAEPHYHVVLWRISHADEQARMR
ncbi:MAG TPA: hypothetical protein VF234_05110 [Limnochordia bacterium]